MGRTSARPLFFIFIFLSFFATGGFAQASKVRGTIQDEVSGATLPFASVRLSALPDSAFISGEVSDLDGKFELAAAPGEYLLQFDFMGYQPMKRRIQITAGINDIGIVKLKPSSKNLEEVVVQGEKSTYELALDKRIFNVGKDLANAGGTPSRYSTTYPVLRWTWRAM